MDRFQALLKSIASIGVDRKYLREIAPEWAIAYPPKSDAELVELKVYYSSLLGLDLASLLNDEARFLEKQCPPLFKRSRNVAKESLIASSSMFAALANYVVAAVRTEYVPLNERPEAVRDEICRTFSASAIGLEELVTFLWYVGIPVIHYSNLPAGLSRPDAMVVNVGGRPCIVVGSKKQQVAWHLFYVAHEVGHIACGHVSEGATLVDQNLDAESENGDAQERQANSFALRLLGNGDATSLPNRKIADPGLLLRQITKYSREGGVDAGHLLLKYATKHKAWDTAAAALKLLSRVNASESINAIASRQLAFDLISPEAGEIVRRALATSTS